MRSYEAARTYFSIMGFGAWSVIIIGVLVALVSAGGVSQYAGGGAGLLAMLPGLGIMIVGFLLLVFVQIGRANVDTAEYTQQMLKISRDQLEVSKQSLKQTDTFQKNYASLKAEATNTPEGDGYSNATLEPEKAVKSKPEPVKQIEQKIAYKGHTILAKDDKFRVNKAVFEKIEFAREHIDQRRLSEEKNAKVAASSATHAQQPEPVKQIAEPVVVAPEIKTPPAQKPQTIEPSSTTYKGKSIEPKGDKYVCNGIPFKTIDAAKNYIDNFAT